MTREEAIKIFNEVLILGKATCTQAEFEELAKMSIQALEQEPTTKNDLGVDREDAVERLNAIKQLIGYDKDSEIVKATQKSLDMAIKALEQESKTGHWIKYGIPRCGEQHYKCTNCDEYFNFGLYSDYYKKAFKFCPNCGCRMVEPQESEEI